MQTSSRPKTLSRILPQGEKAGDTSGRDAKQTLEVINDYDA